MAGLALADAQRRQLQVRQLQVRAVAEGAYVGGARRDAHPLPARLPPRPSHLAGIHVRCAACPFFGPRAQSTSRQRYSLCVGDLAPLGSLRKANPHKKDWQAMHLYLESQASVCAGWG